MRIIAGERRGRRVRSVRDRRLRPTPDRVREALFSIMGDRIRGSRFLDLFAGTGAVGIEALSRGARNVHFVEREPVFGKLIRDNLKDLSLEDKGELLHYEFRRALDLLGRRKIVFDIVFADPPYQSRFGQHVLSRVADSNLLESEGLLIIEHATSVDLPTGLGDLKRTDQRRYGETVLSFYEFNRSERV